MEVDRALQPQPDELSGPNPTRSECSRHLIGFFVQFAIRQPFGATDQRDRELLRIFGSRGAKDVREGLLEQ